MFPFDLSWQDPTVIFTLLGQGTTSLWTGIAYDPSNNSLWVADSVNSFFEDVTLNGGVLSSFIAPQGPLGLALDPADQTLWSYNLRGGVFKQYSKNGNLLSTQTYAALSNFDPSNPNFVINGAEFAFADTTAPEPGGLLLAAIGLTVLCLKRYCLIIR